MMPARMSAVPPWPSPRRAWWAVLIFFLAAVLSYTDRQILLILIDPVRGELALSDTQVGLLQGLAFALVYSIAGLPLGRAADLFPRKIVILAGVLVWSGATVACALSHSFGTLFVGRLFVGVGEACLAPAAMSMIGDYLPPNRRGTGIGIFVLGMVVGSGVAVLIGGSVLQAVQEGLLAGLPYIGALPPWRSVVLLMAAPGLLLALLLLTVAEPARRTHGDSARDDGASTAAVLRFFVEQRALLFPLYVGMAAMAVAENAVLSWIPALLSRDFGMRPADIGNYYGGALIVSASVGILGGGLLADRLVARHGARGRYGFLVVGAIAALPGLLAGGATSVGGVIGLASLFCMLSAGTATVAITAIQDIVPNQMRGVASAVSSVGNILIGVSLGAVLTPWVDTMLFSAGRLDLSMMVAALPLGVISLLLFRRLLALPHGPHDPAAARNARRLC